MALRRIVLRDFVIVHELELNLDDGFTVLTGETGAGKSILIDALQLALGNRADPAVVRTGTNRSEVSVEFDCPLPVQQWLSQAGFDVGKTLLLRRVVDAQGKSRAWINGSPATATQLREIGAQLVDIHGQHAWQSLMLPPSVRALLDAYAGVATQQIAALWSAWREAENTLTQARGEQDSMQRERERLAWQIGEVDKLAPGDDEWEPLNTRHARLANAQSLLDTARSALQALVGDEGSATTQLAEACRLLDHQRHLDPEFKAVSDVLASSLAQAEDAAHSLQGYLRRVDPDPDALAALDDRISLWMTLARRYKRTPADLPALYRSWMAELARLDTAADLGSLDAVEKAAASRYHDAARVLSKARNKAAPKLAAAITEALQGLGMPGGRFEVQVKAAPQPTPSGLDDISFLVAGHPGSPPRPVGKVASGGELSRIALAIAVTTSQLGTAQTLIFDEVDSGVGGAVADRVGQLMKQLGRDRQVLAVTHLPQVAACADHHLVVTKSSTVDSTASTVSAVDGQGRVEEIARMLAGERLSGATVAHAREMLGMEG